jgi:hypothetical protein
VLCMVADPSDAAFYPVSGHLSEAPGFSAGTQYYLDTVSCMQYPRLDT